MEKISGIEEAVAQVSEIIDWVKKGLVLLESSGASHQRAASNVFRLSVENAYYEVVVALRSFESEKPLFIEAVRFCGARSIAEGLSVRERPYFYALGVVCGLWSYDDDLEFVPGLGNLVDLYPAVFSEKTPWELQEMDPYLVRRFLEKRSFGLSLDSVERIFVILFPMGRS